MHKFRSSSHFRQLLSSAAISAAAGLAILTHPLPVASAPAPVTVAADDPAPGFADVVEKVLPAVASVRVSKAPEKPSKDSLRIPGVKGLDTLPDNHPLQRFLQEFLESQKKARPKNAPVASQGSGFFVSADGMLVTNHHVIESGGDITVVLDDGTELEATLVGTDERTDLAVLKVEGDREFTFVGFADDSKIRIGDWVVAVGNPFGLGGSVTAGIISARGRDIGAGPYDDFIQIDAAINRGNSGGPAFNHRGLVVGVNTAIFSPSGGNVGIAFAIPASTVKRVVDSLIENGAVTRGWLGVQIQPVTPAIAESLGLANPSGALIAAALEGSPAAAANLAPGDVVLSLDGKAIADPRELSMTVASMTPGSAVKLGVWKRGKETSLMVTLGEMPGETQGRDETPVEDEQDMSATAQEAFGIQLVTTEDGKGLKVISSDPSGAASAAGIRAGDTILSVNTNEVSNLEDFAKAIAATRDTDRKSVLVMISREAGTLFVAVPLP